MTAGGRSSTAPLPGAFIFSRNGKDISSRFAPIRAALGNIPAYFIIDAELVGCDADGIPEFHALTTGNNHGCCAWCFDLMMIDGKDVRREPLEQRRARPGADPARRRRRPAALLRGLRRCREATRCSHQARAGGHRVEAARAKRTETDGKCIQISPEEEIAHEGGE